MWPGHSITCIPMVNLNYVILECGTEGSWSPCLSYFNECPSPGVPLECVLSSLTPYFLLFHTFTPPLFRYFSACPPSPSMPPRPPPPEPLLSTFLWVQRWENQTALFQILPPQPLTSCLSLTFCPLCPYVCFAISDFIHLPTVLLSFIPSSLFLLSMSPVCLPPLHPPLSFSSPPVNSSPFLTVLLWFLSWPLVRNESSIIKFFFLLIKPPVPHRV